MGDTWSSEEVGWSFWVLRWAMAKPDSDAEIRRESSAEEGRHPGPGPGPTVSTKQLDSGLDLSANASSTTVCQKASQEGPWQFSLVIYLILPWGKSPPLLSRGWGRVGKTEAVGGVGPDSTPPPLSCWSAQGSHQLLSTGHQV